MSDPSTFTSWRESITSGTITKEEYRLVIEHLRAGRHTAAELSALKRAQAGKRKRKGDTDEKTQEDLL